MQTSEQQALRANIFGEHAAFVVALQVVADVIRCVKNICSEFDALHGWGAYRDEREALGLIGAELQRIYDTSNTLDDVDGPAWWRCVSVASLVARSIPAKGVPVCVELMRGIYAQMTAGAEFWSGVYSCGVEAARTQANGQPQAVEVSAE